MSDYLGRLAARALGVGEVAQPRRSLFEPRRGAPEPVASFELDERPRVSAPSPSRAETSQQPPAPEPLPEQHVAHDVRPRRAPPATPPLAERRRAAEHRADAETPAQQVPRGRTPASESVARPASPTPEPAPARQATVRDALVPRAEAPTPQERREVPAVPTLAVRPPPPLNVQAREPEPPTVRVTIGRVDVRAVVPEQPARPKRKPTPAPRVSLDEYLGRTRSAGG